MRTIMMLTGEGFIRKEGVTDEAVTPGHLVERGGSNDFQKHSTAGGSAAPSFALENDLVGEGYTDAYASGDTVQVGYFQTGEEVYAILTTSQTVAVGDYLESAGDGTLRKHDPTTNVASTTAEIASRKVICRALEAVTTTAAVARIKVEVI